MNVYRCSSCGTRNAMSGHDLCEWCDEEALIAREDWPVHQPAAPDAPIPGRHWYSGCEPGGDWDSEAGRYTGTGPRVDPATGLCDGCGEAACRVCGREGCPDHQPEFDLAGLGELASQIEALPVARRS